MAGRLEKPDSDTDLYLARGSEVASARPLMTGDVFQGVIIPGVSEEPVLGMIVTHPCSMRTDGVHLVPSLHVALVEPSETVAWSSCPRDRMPLPTIRLGEFHVVHFDLMSMVASMELESAHRLACLAVRGVNLLQQRLIWYFTRFEVPTGQLNQLFAPVFEEVDMQEEWVEAATSLGISNADAVKEFHEWIRASDASGIRRQDRLKDAQSRSTVRRALDAEIRSRT